MRGQSSYMITDLRSELARVRLLSERLLLPVVDVDGERPRQRERVGQSEQQT